MIDISSTNLETCRVLSDGLVTVKYLTAFSLILMFENST